MSENSLELINEYKDQIRILRQEVAELQDAGKSKDAANKRCLQKLERTNEDLEEALKKIKLLEEKNDQKNIEKIKIFGIDLLLGFLKATSETSFSSSYVFWHTAECLPPIDTGFTFNTWQECSLKGYEESLELMRSSDIEQVNEAKLFVKFYCYEKITEEDT